MGLGHSAFGSSQMALMVISGDGCNSWQAAASQLPKCPPVFDSEELQVYEVMVYSRGQLVVKLLAKSDPLPK